MSRLVMLVIVAVTLTGTNTLAQERGVELQAAAGYVVDSGEGPSTPAVSTGVVVWLSRLIGFGVRVTRGSGDDHYNPPIEGGDRTFLGPGAFRNWAATIQFRGVERGTEFNVGVGWGGHSYEDQTILTGIRRSDDHIDAISPRLFRARYGSEFIAIEFLVGRRLLNHLHLKSGFTYGFSGDLHPFQPVVVFALK